MKQSILVYLLTINGFLLTLNVIGAEKDPYSVSLRTTVGANLDPKETRSSLTLEPLLVVNLENKRTLQFYVAIDRPFSSHENFTLPLTVVKYNHRLNWLPSEWIIHASGSVSALNLHRWSNDGAMNRFSGSFSLGHKFIKGFRAEVVVGVFGQLNQYKQTTKGSNLPTYGFSERLSLGYKTGKLWLDMHLSVSQSHGSSWNNGYRFYQQASYDVTEKMSAGISHEFLGNAVDATTGFYRPITFFDSRESRVSVFVNIEL